MKKLIFILVLFIASLSAYSQLEVVWQKTYPEFINFAKFSQDGKYIYCAVGTTIKKMDAITGEYVSTFTKDSVSGIYDMKISVLGNIIITSNGSGGVTIWDVQKEKMIKNLQLGGWSMDISPDEKYIIVGSFRQDINFEIYEWLSAKLIFNKSGANNTGNKVKYSNDGKMFAIGFPYKHFHPDSGYTDRIRLELWDAKKLQLIKVLQDTSGSDGYWHLDFSKDDKYLAALTTNIFVNTIYNLNENIIDEISSNEIRISNFKFTKDNSKLYYKEGRILDYIDPNNQKYTYNLKDKIMETQGNANQWYVFMGSEKRFTLLKNSITDVSQESEIPYLIINYTQDGILNLRCSYDVEPPLELIISDLIGNRIYQSQLNELVSTKELSVKLNLSNGIYLVKAKTENRIYTQKFQVLR